MRTHVDLLIHDNGKGLLTVSIKSIEALSINIDNELTVCIHVHLNEPDNLQLIGLSLLAAHRLGIHWSKIKTVNQDNSLQ